MKYISLTFKRLKMAVHNFDKNLRSRLNIIIFDRFQSATFKRFNKIFLQFSADYLILSNIKKTRLKNLQVIDIKILKLSIAKSDKINMKFIIIM